jgi:hypothetical protein
VLGVEIRSDFSFMERNSTVESLLSILRWYSWRLLCRHAIGTWQTLEIGNVESRMSDLPKSDMHLIPSGFRERLSYHSRILDCNVH